MTERDDGWQRLIQGLRDGDPQMAREFYEGYGDALHRLAEKHLPAALRRRVGPEDVVQSACRTFLRRARGGEFLLGDGGGLWRLLCAITLTKVRQQTRFHLRRKRGLDQEVHACLAPGDSAAELPLADPAPSPEGAAEFADQFRQLLDGLTEEERRVVDLKLQEHTNEEVAELLGCSERTVRRLLTRIKDQLARTFDV
jgi:RNA polymerase sigma factor (sigma-70 family)